MLPAKYSITALFAANAVACIFFACVISESNFCFFVRPFIAPVFVFAVILKSTKPENRISMLFACALGCSLMFALDERWLFGLPKFYYGMTPVPVFHRLVSQCGLKFAVGMIAAVCLFALWMRLKDELGGTRFSAKSRESLS